MDPKEFYQRLSEFAELKQVKVPKGPGLREAAEPDTVWRNGKQLHLSKDHNPTLTWTIKKLKSKIEICSDCGDSVCDRRVEMKLYEYPWRHWRRNCLACKMTKHPLTGQYDTPSCKASQTIPSDLKFQEISANFKKPAK